MANVKLRYRGPLQDHLKVSEDMIFGNDISEILKYIKKLYGKDACKMAKTMLITVNGENILKRQVFKTCLADGDVITFLPINAGG